MATRVLIVDDDTGVLETLADVLEARGYAVAVASGGAAALEWAHREAFDLAIIDIKMPDMNGVEVWRQLKGLSPRTAAIMMTAHSVEDLITEALSEGARRVLYKPLDMDVVLSLIESV